MKQPQTINQRLVRMIEDATGAKVTLLQGVKGFWKKQDVYRWEGWIEKDGIPCSICSWNTMSECVRYGFDLMREDSGFVADAKGKSATSPAGEKRRGGNK